MSLIIRMISLLLALVSGSATVSAQDGEAGAAMDREVLYTQLSSSSIYERRKALKTLLAVAPDDTGTVEVLIQLFRSQDADEVRYQDFMQRVGQALQATASKMTWTPGNVELLTGVLVHNDAYDSRATNRTAATVAGVARYQAFSRKALDDLTTVLWHRVDKNPNRTRNDNTRSYVAQALRHIVKRQGLPDVVIATSVASLGSETNASVRRETVLLIDEFVRAQPASEAVVQALVRVLEHDANTTVRTLAARSLRHISEQRDHPPSLVTVLQQAVAGDPEAAVRREALAGLIAAAAMDPPSPGVLAPEAMEQLLQSALGDPDTRVRFQAIQVLGKVYATEAPDPATLQRLIKRLGEEPDAQVRSHIAVTLQAIHTDQGLAPAMIEPLIPLVTDDPVVAVRQAIGRILIELPAGKGGLTAWLRATAAAGLSPAGVATPAALPERVPRHDRDALSILQARLLGQYVSALSGARDRAVRTEILQGLFALAQAESLPPQAVDVLARRLDSDADAGLRLQAAAVLLYNGLRHQGEKGPFYAALDDGDARVQDYAAFALVELSAVDGELLPGLLGFARDPSAHRTLRGYSLRRLGLWRAAGGVLPASAQAVVQDLTRNPDVELRTAAWGVLRHLDLTEQDWRRAAADDDPGIQRMAWRELQALGVTKPVRAKWRDPKQRLELIAAGLLGATVVAVVAGSLLFFWRLLRWWLGTRQQRGRMLTAQLLWLVAALLTVAADAGILFAVGMAHSGLSVKDLMQLNTLFGVILGLYVAVAYLGWRLLPPR